MTRCRAMPAGFGDGKWGERAAAEEKSPSGAPRDRLKPVPPRQVSGESPRGGGS
jgi:hypothetical protein